MQNYHLVHKDGNWKLKKEGAQRASISFADSTKEEAVKGSAEFLQQNAGGSLKIHKVNGGIQEERTYPRSADPRKSKG